MTTTVRPKDVWFDTSVPGVVTKKKRNATNDGWVVQWTAPVAKPQTTTTEKET